MERPRRVTRHRIAGTGLLAAAGRTRLGAGRRRLAAATTPPRPELSAGSGGSIDVVGYSTPESVYEEAPRAGLRRNLRRAAASASATRSAPPATRAARSRPASPPRVVHFSQAGDMERLVEAGHVDAGLGQAASTTGIAQDSVVVIVVRKGNPEGIKSFDDLLNKDVEVITPNPFSSGSARWNIMAVYGTAAQRGQVPDAGARRGQDRCSRRRSSSPAAPATRSPPSPRARATSCSATRTRRSRPQNEGEDVDYVIPPEHDPDRDPDRGHQGRVRAGAGLPRLHLVRRRSGNLGRKRLPPGQPEAGRPEAVPDPEGSVHDRPVRRLGQGQRRVLRRRNRLGRRRSRRNSGSRPAAEPWRRNPATARSATPGGGIRLPGVGAGLGRGMVALYLIADRAAAAGRGRRRSRSRAASAPSGTRSPASQSIAALKLTVICSLIVVVDQRRLRHDHRLGPGPRRVPRQGRWSTRSSTSPSRCRRSSPA